MPYFFSLLDSKNFFEKYWGRSHYIFKTEFNILDYKQIIDTVIASNIHYPQLRIIERGGSISPYLYTDSDNNSLSNKINVAKFENLDLTGRTIKISGLEKYIKDISDLVDDVSAFFSGVDVSVNGYFSAENALGGSPHYDFYHIFAFQISGEKKWKIGSIVEHNPHKDLGHQLVENIDFYSEVKTSPGDVLYLPPGIWHDVSTDTGSVHFAIGIQTPRIFNLLHQAIINISKTSSLFRANIPLKYLNNIENVELSDNVINELLGMLKTYLQENNSAELLRKK